MAEYWTPQEVADALIKATIERNTAENERDAARIALRQIYDLIDPKVGLGLLYNIRCTVADALGIKED